jgi:hypothetical protein
VPQAALVPCPVQLDQQLVEPTLISGIDPAECRSDLSVHVRSGGEHSLAEIYARITVAELYGLVLTRGCAGGHGRSAECP